MSQKQPQYKFYATLLDGFQGYLDSSEIYQQYWGFSTNPKKTEEEFEIEQFNGLIDRINRIPFESEPAAKGTAFNELIDCIIEHRKSEDYLIVPDKQNNVFRVSNDNYDFTFPYGLSMEIANELEGAICQVRLEATIETKYGTVLLYGYVDQVMPFHHVDLKTTKKYNAQKFRKNWQHRVYPYCAIENGNQCDHFEYKVTNFKQVFSEVYAFNPEIDVPAIRNHCERFIEFLEANKEMIHDKKIFVAA